MEEKIAQLETHHKEDKRRLVDVLDKTLHQNQIDRMNGNMGMQSSHSLHNPNMGDSEKENSRIEKEKRREQLKAQLDRARQRLKEDFDSDKEDRGNNRKQVVEQVIQPVPIMNTNSPQTGGYKSASARISGTNVTKDNDYDRSYGTRKSPLNNNHSNIPTQQLFMQPMPQNDNENVIKSLQGVKEDIMSKLNDDNIYNKDMFHNMGLEMKELKHKVFSRLEELEHRNRMHMEKVKFIIENTTKNKKVKEGIIFFFIY